jgi:hypothetical protein
MFTGDDLAVDSFEVIERIAGKRLRLIAEVNGQKCFVKTFGDPTVQCAVDELKRLVGLPAIGVSRAKIDPYGAVTICRFHPHVDHLGHLPPDPALLPFIVPVLMFDVIIANNDRTDTNFLKLTDGTVLPIDESAAFKKPSTCRLRGWKHVVRRAAICETPGTRFAPLADTVSVAHVLKRTGLQAWASTSLDVAARAKAIDRHWSTFLSTFPTEG